MSPIERLPVRGLRAPRSPVAALEPEAAVRFTPPGAMTLAVDAPLFSIRVPPDPGRRPCGLCSQRFLAAGPTGHRDDEPICDACLLEHESQLGMLLSLLAVVRSYGSGWPRDDMEEDHARLELMAFARVYENYASKHAAARPMVAQWPWPAEPGPDRESE